MRSSCTETPVLSAASKLSDNPGDKKGEVLRNMKNLIYPKNFTMKFTTSNIITSLHQLLLTIIKWSLSHQVLLAFVRNRSLRTPGNYFLMSLATSDLIMGLWTFPNIINNLFNCETWMQVWDRLNLDTNYSV